MLCEGISSTLADEVCPCGAALLYRPDIGRGCSQKTNLGFEKQQISLSAARSRIEIYHQEVGRRPRESLLRAVKVTVRQK
jgi:hypothetical protein